jgi:hydrogenase-4 component B
MQYTAGSFASVITGWFSSVLRPARHDHRPEGCFPGPASYSEHAPETVLEYVVAPAARAMMRVSAMARALQHGRAQSYLLYLLAGVAGLSVLVVLGGGQ